MLSNAVQKPNIDYQEASAERLPFADSRVDVITSGQAFHWFDHPKFFGEAKRILKPRGTLAIFGYSVSIIKDNKEATDIFYEYATGLIGNPVTRSLAISTGTSPSPSRKCTGTFRTRVMTRPT
ncbi:S-adenosyl-L-methionine-dependent methyltransferase [Jimgerdemannia flammicorona]|uniref:S-adenosyl-L-methionine-dependent methyltransferase n=1 Tax=Jimgerdemannia flammicorona TaxID=994334 RepID=A0A433DDM5_9FUNG|nr:S-adenosyl-L-methionine-dependent methyltransferase [Jimgerdemannia flammicorona]